MMRRMSKRFTLAEFLDSVDLFERDLDRSKQAIERCIQRLDAVQQRLLREQAVKSEADRTVRLSDAMRHAAMGLAGGRRLQSR
jgi:hypothetical protein